MESKKEKINDNKSFNQQNTITPTMHQTIVVEQKQARARCTNLLKRVLQFVELLLVLEARVHHEHEHWGTEVAPGNLVLDSCELGQQLGWEVLFSDVCSVVCGKLVSCASEWAGPRLGMVINSAMWIQDAATAVAADRLILEGTRVTVTMLERGVPDKWGFRF